MKYSAVLFCLIVATTVLAQETESVPQKRFVSDKLVLNVYAAAEQGSGRVATIQTGDAVEELERSGTMVRVRLEDGREGWVGASYLVSDAPAIVRLRELQGQQSASAPAPQVDKVLVDELAQFKKENIALRAQVASLQARPVTPVVTPAVCEEVSETPVVEPPIQAASFPMAAPAGSIWGWLVAMIFVGGASYVTGYQSLARRLRKKFGGLKIY